MAKSFDAERFCIDYSIPYWTTGKNTMDGCVSIQCTECDDHSNHGSFIINDGKFVCWRCGGHPLYKVLQSLTGLNNVKPIMRRYSFVTDDDDEEEEHKTITEVKVPGNKVLWPRAKKYLRSRNFDPNYLSIKYDLRATRYEGGGYAFRIISPVYVNNKIVSYQGRDYTKKQELRYRACRPENEIIPIKDTLYNIDNCRKRVGIAVEGNYDVYRMGDGCFGTYGTSFTPAQINMMACKFDRVFFCFDPEPEAQKKAEKAIVSLEGMGVDCELIGLEDIDDDIGALSDDDAKHLKDQLIPSYSSIRLF